MQELPIIRRLKADLLAARKARDGVTANALQSALARISNAEAVPQDYQGSAYREHLGVGSSETPRRMLSEQDIRSIIQAEIGELSTAIAAVAQHEDHPYARELKQKADILSKYL